MVDGAHTLMTLSAVCASEVCFALSRSTQKERDTESGNDYFFARYYTSALGRFTTPDWSAKITPVPYAVFTDPQSLNLYAYVRNNPITHVDLDGHCEGFGCQMQQDWIAQHQIGNLTDKQVSDAGLVRLDPEKNAGSSSSGGPSFSLKVGGVHVSGTFTPNNGPNSKGVHIVANQHGCKACRWAQIDQKTGQQAHPFYVDNRGDFSTPLYDQVLSNLDDRPTNYENGSWNVSQGSFTAVSVLGVPDYSNHTFSVKGAMTWGYSIDASGNLNLTRPRSIDPSAAVQVLNAQQPDWKSTSQ